MGAAEKSFSLAAAAESCGGRAIDVFPMKAGGDVTSASDAVASASFEQEPLARGRCPVFPPLAEVTSPCVGTAAAAYYLNRKPQTLRIWASQQSGPLTSIVINGRRAWPVDAIRALHSGLPLKQSGGTRS